MDYVKSIISEIIPGLWTLWTNYEHYEVPEPLMYGSNKATTTVQKRMGQTTSHQLSD